MPDVKRMSDAAIFRQMEYWMVVCRNKATGEMVGWTSTLFDTRADALASRRKLVGLRESVVAVRIVPIIRSTKKRRTP